MKFGGLAAGVTEHDALIARSPHPPCCPKPSTPCAILADCAWKKHVNFAILPMKAFLLITACRGCLARRVKVIMSVATLFGPRRFAGNDDCGSWSPSVSQATRRSFAAEIRFFDRFPKEDVHDLIGNAVADLGRDGPLATLSLVKR